MNIYVAASIRGGTFSGSQSALEIIQTVGRERGHTIISQHSAVTGLAEILPDPQLYRRDMEWLAQSQFLIAEISAPSIGVGYEICQALGLELPVLCVCHSAMPLSAIISGNPSIETKIYTDHARLRNIVNKFLERHE